jgi:hypothetical protein
MVQNKEPVSFFADDSGSDRVFLARNGGGRIQQRQFRQFLIQGRLVATSKVARDPNRNERYHGEKRYSGTLKVTAPDTRLIELNRGIFE